MSDPGGSGRGRSFANFQSAEQRFRQCLGAIGSLFIDLVTETRDPHQAAWRLLKKEHKELFQNLRIQDPYARDFFDCFRYIDTDASDTIEYEEFLDFFSIGDTKFLERFYKDFDTDNSGSIEFDEFLIQTWNLCSRTKRGLMKYMFNIFDDDKNGWLSPPEIVGMVKLVYAKGSLEGTRIEHILTTIDKNGDGRVTFDETVRFFDANPQILAPLFECQRKLYHGVCSADWWRTMADWRVLQFGEDSTIEDILGARNSMSTELKEAKKAEQQAALEEAQDKMMAAAAERVKQAMKDSRKITRLEYVKLVIAWAEKRYYDLCGQNASSDVQKTQFMAKSSAAFSAVAEIEKEVAEVWALKFEKLARDVIDNATGAASDFLDSPIGQRVVENAGRALLLKSQREQATSGNRLDLNQARRLVREKLQDTLVTQSQQQVEVDRRKMSETRQEDLRFIKAQMDDFEAPVLQSVMAGNEKLIALVTDLQEAEVRDLKELDGGWFANLLEQRAKEAAEQVPGAIRFKRTEGTFLPSAEIDFHRRHLKASCKKHKLPMCPKCSTEASTDASKFCRFCRSQLWRRLFDENSSRVYYVSCIDEESTFTSPFSEEHESRILQHSEPELDGQTTTNVDTRFVGLTETLGNL